MGSLGLCWDNGKKWILLQFGGRDLGSHHSNNLNDSKNSKGGFVWLLGSLSACYPRMRTVSQNASHACQFIESCYYMVVSQNRGTPVWTAIYYNPYSGDTQNGTPPPPQFWETSQMDVEL